MSDTTTDQKCGHVAEGSAAGPTAFFVCDRPAGHAGWHQQTGGPGGSTNWGDDGLSIFASKDETRRKAGRPTT